MDAKLEAAGKVLGVCLIFFVFMVVAMLRINRLQEELARYKNAPADTVTVFKTDTLLYDNPQLIERYESEKEQVAIEVRKLKKQLAEALSLPPDTLEIHDTATQIVYLPREYLVYKDSTYRAVVSGVQPRLDSIEIYRPTITQTVIKYVSTSDKKRWGRGVQAGYGWNGRKASPYIGAGVQYNLVRW